MKEQPLYPIDAILRSEEAILEFGRCVRKAAFHIVQFRYFSEFGTIRRLEDAFVRASAGSGLAYGIYTRAYKHKGTGLAGKPRAEDFIFDWRDK